MLKVKVIMTITIDIIRFIANIHITIHITIIAIIVTGSPHKVLSPYVPLICYTHLQLLVYAENY